MKQETKHRPSAAYSTLTLGLLRFMLIVTLIVLLSWILLLGFYLFDVLIYAGNGEFLYKIFDEQRKVSILYPSRFIAHIVSYYNSALAEAISYSHASGEQFFRITHHYLPKAKSVHLPAIINDLYKGVGLVSACILLRTLTYLQFQPFMLAILGIAFIDGIVIREIRKYQVSRERTFIFHRSKALLGRVYFLILLLYLSLPYPIPPVGYWLLSTVIIGFLMQITIRSYKKYA
jgi:hypothetical protein